MIAIRDPEVTIPCIESLCNAGAVEAMRIRSPVGNARNVR